MEELRELVYNKISILAEEISNIHIDGEEKILYYIDYINRNVNNEDLTYLENINLDELKNLLPNEFDVDILNLRFYIVAINTSYGKNINNYEQVVTQIEGILGRINNYFTKIINENEKAISLTDKKNNLELLLKKIEDHDDIYEDEINTIFELLMELDNKEKAINLLISLGENILSNNETKDNHLEDSVKYVFNKDTQQVKNELITTFKEYGLDFNEFFDKLRNSMQNEFLNYVRVDNVRDILGVLKTYDIDLNDSYFDLKLLTTRAIGIYHMLMHSDKEILKNLLEFIQNSEQLRKKDIKDRNGKIKEGIDFDFILEKPGRFIKRKKRYKVKGNQTLPILINGNNFGYAKDFIDNLTLFNSLGITFREFCSNVAIEEMSNVKIKRIIEIFKLYGISHQSFRSALSCFISYHQAESIDQFTELNAYDYIVHNLSKCRLQPDDQTFYRLVFAIKHTTIPMDDIIRPDNKLAGIISDVKDDTLGIDNMHHMDKKVEQYKLYDDSDARQLYQLYDSYTIDSTDPDISLAIKRSDSIIHMLDENFLLKEENGKVRYPNVYYFGDVDIIRGKWPLLISRNKVLRLTNALLKHNVIIDDVKTIMYILTKNSILTREEYNLILSKIEKQRIRGVSK